MRYTSGSLFIAGLSVLVAGAAHAQSYYIGQVRPVFQSWCPRGTTAANGSLLSISDHNALFSILGCEFGGDCRTNFAVPDLQARSPLGAGTSDWNGIFELGQKGGEPVRMNETQLPTHSHDLVASEGRPTTGNPAGALPPSNTSLPSYASRYDSSSAVSFNRNAVSSGSGSDPMMWNDYHPVLAITFCIQLTGVYPVPE